MGHEDSSLGVSIAESTLYSAESGPGTQDLILRVDKTYSKVNQDRSGVPKLENNGTLTFERMTTGKCPLVI